MKIIIFIILIFQCFTQETWGSIKRVSSFQEISRNLAVINKDTLLVFDVYKVLIFPEDKILQEEHGKELENLSNKLKERVGELKIQEILSRIWLYHNVKLVDPNIPSIISDTLNKGIKVIALTNFPTGSYGLVPSMEDLRIRTLKKKGIDFSSSFPEFPYIRFDNIKCNDTGEFASFKGGILFSCSTPKGPLLEVFLKLMSWKPKCIVFIDDKYKNLESVEKIAKKLGIDFIGIEYVALVKNNTDPLIEKRGALQLDVIDKEHKWISDEEANKRCCSEELGL